MKRIIDYFLLEWKTRSNRKPLLLRGARQVGKTHAARCLGKTFPFFIEVNLENNEMAKKILQQDLDVKRIILQLSELFQITIEPGKTLLFFDEIQTVPKTITTLRYFYELIPDLHVIAAGSLLDFAIEQVGMPVGRISSLYMYPLSFLEFLVALGNKGWAQTILNHTPEEPLSEALHNKLLSVVATYLAIGGMPEAINEWISTQISRTVKVVHADLLYSYQQDFGKYAKKHQIKYLNLLFKKSLEQLSKKFVYARVGEYQKRELEPALELLEKAGLIYNVTKTAGQGIPLGAQSHLDFFKVIFLDVGLTQALNKLDIASWLISPEATLINKGAIVESFVGQELLAYSDPVSKQELFYWIKESRSSSAEIDYLVQLQEQIIPIEVKAGTSKHLTSLTMFLQSHPHSPYGIRYSAHNFTKNNTILTYPLYAVANALVTSNDTLKEALSYLTS